MPDRVRPDRSYPPLDPQARRTKMTFLDADAEAQRGEGLHLHWNNITFDVELSDVVAKAQTPGPDGQFPKFKTILHGVTAQAPSNSLMAVMVRLSLRLKLPGQAS